jgi:signal transduction histidine kinase
MLAASEERLQHFSLLSQARAERKPGATAYRTLMDEKRKAEAERDRYLGLVDELGYGIVWEAEAPTLQLRFIGAPVENELGYPRARWLEPGFFFERVHAEDRVRALECLRAALLFGDGAKTHFEHRFIGADGRAVWFESFVHVRRLEGAHLVLHGLSIDIADRKRVEEESESAGRLRELFIGILGHDLRNPLSAIRVATSSMLRRGVGDADARTLGRIDRSAERMNRMIEDLLDFTRCRLGGGMPIQRRAVDVFALAAKVADELELAHPGFQVHCEREGACRAECDPDRLEQLLSNLMSNGIAHGERYGTVEVTVRERGAEVAIDVRNRGPAIAPSLLPVLFDPFKRGSATRGLGLGLYIAQQIVLGHRGTITVDSSEAAGTVVRVRLPQR